MASSFCFQKTVRMAIWGGLISAACFSFVAHADTPTLGVGISKLTYREPSLDVTHDAWLPTVQAQWAPDNLQLGSWPIGFVGMWAQGQGHYSGTGTMEGQPIQLWQIQVQSVQTAWLEGYLLTPSLGYRQFDNDARGFTSTGEQGYRRTSEYWFAGLGIEQSLANGWRWNGQLRYLLAGRQTTNLGDVSGDVGKIGTVKNAQHRGYGLNLGVCHTMNALDVCPSVEYWRISESDTVSARVNGNNYLMSEPANTTKTFQLMIHHKF